MLVCPTKGKEISNDQIEQILKIHRSNQEGEFSQIHKNKFFGYTKVVIEQPLIEEGQLQTDRRGKRKPDTSKRDYERIPLSENMDQYFSDEIQPHLPGAWMDRSKDKVGYEINLNDIEQDSNINEIENWFKISKIHPINKIL